MSGTLSIRVDEETRRELSQLTKDGQSRNAAIVDAIHLAYRESVYEDLRRSSTRLRDDPEYQAEVVAAREDMGAGDAW